MNKSDLMKYCNISRGRESAAAPIKDILMVFLGSGGFEEIVCCIDFIENEVYTAENDYLIDGDDRRWSDIEVYTRIRARG